MVVTVLVFQVVLAIHATYFLQFQSSRRDFFVALDAVGSIKIRVGFRFVEIDGPRMNGGLFTQLLPLGMVGFVKHIIVG